MTKRALSERDICSKFITPALVSARWDLMSQIREEVSFTKGRVIVRGKLSTRGEAKRKENEFSWRVPISLITDSNYNLDIKNPHAPGTTVGDVDQLLPEYEKLLAQIAETRARLKQELQQALKH